MDGRTRATTLVAGTVCAAALVVGAWLVRPGGGDDARTQLARGADPDAPSMRLAAHADDARHSDDPRSVVPAADAARPLELPAVAPPFDGVIDEFVERLVVVLDVGCPVVDVPSLALLPVGGGSPWHAENSVMGGDICVLPGFRVTTPPEVEPRCPFVDLPQIPDAQFADGDYDVTILTPSWSADPLRLSLRRGEPSRTLRLPAEALTRVSGTVTCVPAAPPPDEIVVTLAYAGLTDERDVRTRPDASGAFCLVGWDAPETTRALRVTVTAAGRSNASSDWIAIDDPHDFALEDLRFELVGEAAITGRVFDARTGAPLSAEVALEPSRASWEAPDDLEPSEAQAATDADGRYRLLTRAPAEFILSVASDGGGWRSDPLRVEPGQKLVRDVALAGPATLAGRVVDRSTNALDVPMRVRAVQADETASDSRGDDGSVPLRSDGTFVLTDLAAGRCVAQVLLEVDPRMRFPIAAADVELVSGETTEIELVVGGHVVSGTFLGPDDLDLAILALAGDGLSPVSLPARPDPAGRFSLEVAGPGDYVCFVSGTDDQGSERRIVFASTPFTLRDDGTLATPLLVDALRTRLELVHPARDEPAFLAAFRPRFVRLAIEPDDPRLARLDRWTSELPLPPGRTLTLFGLPGGRCSLSWKRATPGPTPPVRTFRLRENDPERVVLDDD
ncbi:MAG: carboxypeptidase regulatory-like domain-containing protein [Planctomycetes bacterium]|nr:carboxypeptidase regulatory-like domain-containing protein [Planctomycetota bacterium]